jgi:hypothetical protein
MSHARTLPKDYEDQWFRFLGYGNPLARVWFIGSEPGGDPAPGPPNPHLSTWQRFGKIWTYGVKPDLSEQNSSWDMVGEVLEASGLAARQDQWTTAMLANMAPLPRPGEDDDHGGSTAAVYTQRVKDERIAFFRELIVALDGPQVMIFFGKGAWTKYGVVETLQLQDDDGDLGANTGSRVRHFGLGTGKHVVLTNHPSRPFQFSKDDQRNLGRQLARWLR